MFKDPIILYAFEDNQYIKTKETPCFKFDLSILLRKYFMYDETKQRGNQSMTPEEMLQNQMRFYDRAVNEIIEEASDHIHKVKVRRGVISSRASKVDHRYLFTLDG